MPKITACLMLLSLLLVSSVTKASALAAALAAEEARQFTKAEQLLGAVDNKDSDFYYYMARVQYRAGDFERADETLQELFELAPDHAEGYYLSGLVNLALVGEVSIFRKVGVAGRALDAWKAAVRHNEDHIDARYAIFAFYASAPGIAGGDIDKAKVLAGELMLLDKGYGAMAMALVHSKEEKTAAAEASFLSAIEHLGRAGPHFALAQFYLQNERFAEAVTHVEQYQAKEKRWWDAEPSVTHLVMAHAKNGLGDVTAARDELEQGLALNPNKRVREMLQKALKDL